MYLYGNSAFLLAIVAMPMDSAYSMHNVYRHVLSAHAQLIINGLVYNML